MSGESEFGKDLGIAHEAVITGRKVGANREFWKTLAHNPHFFEQVVKMHNGPITAYSARVLVDYQASVDSLLASALEGGHLVHNPDRRVDFLGHIQNKHMTLEDVVETPVDERVYQDMATVYFNTAMTTEELLDRLEEYNLRPATLLELLHFSLLRKMSEYPRNIDGLIMALGTVLNGKTREITSEYSALAGWIKSFDTVTYRRALIIPAIDERNWFVSDYGGQTVLVVKNAL